MARTDVGHTRLLGLWDGSITLPQLPFSQEHRRLVIQRLVTLNQPKVRDLINQELINDPSDVSRLYAIAAAASLPNAKVKKKCVDYFMGGLPW